MKIEYGGNCSKFSELKPGDVYRFACSGIQSFYLCYIKFDDKFGEGKRVGHINLSTSLEHYAEHTGDTPVIIYKDVKLVIGKE